VQRHVARPYLLHSSILILPASIKVVPVHAMKAYCGIGDVAPLVPNFVRRYRQAKSRQNIAVGFSFLGFITGLMIVYIS
jgi:hypothetical protein